MSYCVVFFSASPVQQATMDLELGGIIEGDADSFSDSDDVEVE
jgi:hypothetical protein